MLDIMTSPLRTATPDRAMNPTAAETEKGIPRSHNNSTPPLSASGTAEKTIAARLADPSAA